MDSDVNSDFEQLMVLKELTKTTGVLHSAQLLQLKNYPLILTHCVKCEVSIDTTMKLVIYKLLKFEGKVPSDIQERFNLLNKWVQTLLGKEYIIEIHGFESKVKNGKRKTKRHVKRRVNRQRK